MINKNKIILLTLLSVALTIAIGSVFHLKTTQQEQSNYIELEIKEAFSEWSLQHKRLYSSADEHSLRYRTFKANYLHIKEVNEQDRGFTLSLNESADLSDKEFAIKYGLSKPEIPREFSEKSKLKFEESVQQNHVYEVNWQELHRANTAKNIGTCSGAAAILSGVSVFESTQSIYGNAPVEHYSSQKLLDCMGFGCNSIDTTVLPYLTEFGTVLESKYPWTGRPATCKKFQGETVKLFDYGYIYRVSGEKMIALVANSPILTWISLDANVRFYSGGIIHPKQGECRDSDQGVPITVDGFQVDEKGKGYLLLKFPWGTNYGENGNMMMYRDTDSGYYDGKSCSIYDKVFYLTK